MHHGQNRVSTLRKLSKNRQFQENTEHIYKFCGNIWESYKFLEIGGNAICIIGLWDGRPCATNIGKILSCILIIINVSQGRNVYIIVHGDQSTVHLFSPIPSSHSPFPYILCYHRYHMQTRFLLTLKREFLYVRKISSKILGYEFSRPILFWTNENINYTLNVVTDSHTIKL